jgi:(E)-4-hydroxy-3-methylbut-2-enyl-diphosphate synthase
VRRSLADVTAPLTVAVMGCPVNGPGEAKAADVGLAGGRGKAVIFRRGKILKTVPESRMIDALTDAVREEVERLGHGRERG